MREVTRTLLSILVAGMLAACTGTTPERVDALDFATPRASATTGPTGPTDATGATASPETPSDIAHLGGRLAVLAGDGSLETMRPDGTQRVTLAEPDSDRQRIQQPSWAPDGDRLAWVRAELQDNATVTGVVETSNAEGEEPTVTHTDVYPFYLSWDPTSSRVGYLGALSPQAIGFGVVELDATDEPTHAIDHGQPFYLSWGPDGRELLAHVGQDRLERLALDGATRTVTERPGTFNVPFWTDDGSTLIYGTTERGGDQTLVSQDARTGRRTSLLGFPDGLVFLPNADGSKIAYQQVAASRPAGPLTVLDVETGERTPLVDHLVATFSWSPDGEKLLYLDPPTGAEPMSFRWGLWDGGSVSALQRLVPSALMVQNYLPFFEQYAQSMTMWSPDSSAFAYAAMSVDGEAGIWVQEARADRAPVLVSDGDFVSWSPA